MGKTEEQAERIRKAEKKRQAGMKQLKGFVKELDAGMESGLKGVLEYVGVHLDEHEDVVHIFLEEYYKPLKAKHDLA